MVTVLAIAPDPVMGKCLTRVASEAFVRYRAQVERHPLGPGAPCTRGCSSCCYLPVNATWAEVAIAVHAADAYFGKDHLASRVANTASIVSGLNESDRIRLRIACPLLLADKTCAIYVRRPLYCRAFNALSSNSQCERLVGLQTGVADLGATVVMDPLPFDVAATEQREIDRQLTVHGIDATHVELTAGMQRLLGG